jgi:hypothetical protein
MVDFLRDYYFRDLDLHIDESPDKMTPAIWTCQFLKKVDFESGDINVETLAVLVDVRKFNEDSYAIRINRNAFRDHEFDRYEEHQWRVEPKSNLQLFYPPFPLVIGMSLGHTINIETGEVHEPEYTWSYKIYENE